MSTSHVTPGHLMMTKMVVVKWLNKNVFPRHYVIFLTLVSCVDSAKSLLSWQNNSWHTAKNDRHLFVRAVLPSSLEPFMAVCTRYPDILSTTSRPNSNWTQHITDRARSGLYGKCGVKEEHWRSGGGACRRFGGRRYIGQLWCPHTRAHSHGLNSMWLPTLSGAKNTASRLCDRSWSLLPSCAPFAVLLLRHPSSRYATIIALCSLSHLPVPSPHPLSLNVRSFCSDF